MGEQSELQGLILTAGREARALGHSYVGSIHLLLALAQSAGTAGNLLTGAGFDPQLARSMAAVLYGSGTPGLPLPKAFPFRHGGSCMSPDGKHGCREADG